MNNDAITYQVIGGFIDYDILKHIIQVKSNRGVVSQFPVKREFYISAKEDFEIGKTKIIPFDDLIPLIDTDDLTEIK